jgi:hypothetical protein
MVVAMLLDFLTIFFLVAGVLLLWLNIRRRAGDVILTQSDEKDPSVAKDVDPEPHQ